jgi:hypothetical protein
MALGGTQASESILMIQAPTWEVNPTVPVSFFEEEYQKDPNKFNCEFGAQFTDTLSAWLEDEQILTPCLDLQLRPETRGRGRVANYMGLDVAVVNDRTALVLTRPEGDKIKLVYHEQWQAGVDWQELNPHLPEGPWFPYAENLKQVRALDFDMIAEWIAEVHKRFYVAEGLFDQWTGISLEQSLVKLGLTEVHSKQFTRNESGMMFQAFKQFLYHNKLWLYDHPCKDSTGGDHPAKHSKHIQELLELEASFEGKGFISVEAPKIRGKHDDFSDALVRSVWLSSQAMKKGAADGGQAAALSVARQGVGFDPYNQDNWINGQIPVGPLSNAGATLHRQIVSGSPRLTQRPSGALLRRMRGRGR